MDADNTTTHHQAINPAVAQKGKKNGKIVLPQIATEEESKDNNIKNASLVASKNNKKQSINQENKTAHVEEYTENIAILYQHDMEYNESTLLSNGKNIKDTIVFLAQTKNKTFPSLTSKCIFKYMDICDM